MMKTRKIPQRRCVGCREMKDKVQLMRIAHKNDGSLFIDTTDKAGGRGAYLCKSIDCLEKARKTKGLERSLGKGCVVPQEVYDSLAAKL